MEEILMKEVLTKVRVTDSFKSPELGYMFTTCNVLVNMI